MGCGFSTFYAHRAGEGPGLLAGRFYGTLDGKQRKREEQKTSMDESTPVNLKPLECRSNRPHQFSTANGIFVTKIEPGRAEGLLQVTRDSLNPHGKVHGGALAALADTVGGNCACARGRSCVTASQSMEFLRPAEGPYITCVATPKKEGHTLSVIQVELSNAEGKLVATGTFTFFMMDQW